MNVCPDTEGFDLTVLCLDDERCLNAPSTPFDVCEACPLIYHVSCMADVAIRMHALCALHWVLPFHSGQSREC